MIYETICACGAHLHHDSPLDCWWCGRLAECAPPPEIERGEQGGGGLDKKQLALDTIERIMTTGEGIR